MHCRQFGKSISEYALILALVVLVAVPAVMYMGGVLDEYYQSQDPNTQAADLIGLLDSNMAGGGSGVLDSGFVLDGYEDYGDVISGTGGSGPYNVNLPPNIEVPLLPNGEEAQGTDGQLTAILSDMLVRLAEDGVDDEGNPIDPTLAAKLKKLSTHGFNTAGKEDVANSIIRSGNNSFRSRQGADTARGLAEELISFNDTYRDVQSYISEKGNYTKLKEELQYPAGTISHLGNANYVTPILKGFENAGVPKKIINATLGMHVDKAQHPVGAEPTADVPVDLTPYVTDDQSERIRRRARKPNKDTPGA